MNFPHWLCQGQRRHILTAVHEALQFTSPAVVLDHILVHYIAQWLSAQCTQHAEFSAHISQTDPVVQPGKVERHSQSFWREAEMLSNLNHPNVLRFYGVVVESYAEPNVIGIMTEYMKGGSLAAFLRLVLLTATMASKLTSS